MKNILRLFRTTRHTNIGRSSHYVKALVTIFFRCNPLVVSLFKAFIAIQSLYCTTKLCLKYGSVFSPTFLWELKDDYLWSIAGYKSQYSNLINQHKT